MNNSEYNPITETPPVAPAPPTPPAEPTAPSAPPSQSNKKPLALLVAGVAVVAVVGVFTFLYTAELGPFKKTTSSTQGETESISSEPLYTVDNYPRVDASTATHPLAIAYYENFTADTTKTYSDFGFSKTHQAYLGLIGGEKDLILVTSPSKEELDLAKQKNMELEVTPVVKEGFVFFVSVDNPIDSLTSEQVRDIYAGKIKNWKEVGGEDKPIIAYQRPTNSGSQTGMLDLVMKGTPIMTPPTESWMISSMTEIVDAVSGYNNANDAIGYSYYYYATTMYQDIDQEVADGIKLIAIDGVKPGEATIKSGEYPFNTAYYVVINKAAGEDSPARRLKDQMLSSRGQSVAKGAGYVPVK